MNVTISRSVAVSFGRRGLKRMIPSRARHAPVTITIPSTSSALAKIEPMTAYCATITSPGGQREQDDEELRQVPERRLEHARHARAVAVPDGLRRDRHDPRETGESHGCGRERDQVRPVQVVQRGCGHNHDCERRQEHAVGAAHGCPIVGSSRTMPRRRRLCGSHRSGQSGSSARSRAIALADRRMRREERRRGRGGERVDRVERLGRRVRAELDELARLLQPEERVGEPVRRSRRSRRRTRSARTRASATAAAWTNAEAIGPSTNSSARSRKPPIRLSSTSAAAKHHGRRLDEHVTRADVRELVREHALELGRRQRRSRPVAHADRRRRAGPRPTTSARGMPVAERCRAAAVAMPRCAARRSTVECSAGASASGSSSRADACPSTMRSPYQYVLAASRSTPRRRRRRGSR